MSKARGYAAHSAPGSGIALSAPAHRTQGHGITCHQAGERERERERHTRTWHGIACHQARTPHRMPPGMHTTSHGTRRAGASHRMPPGMARPHGEAPPGTTGDRSVMRTPNPVRVVEPKRSVMLTEVPITGPVGHSEALWAESGEVIPGWNLEPLEGLVHTQVRRPTEEDDTQEQKQRDTP
jgi:hypothetical protein